MKTQKLGKLEASEMGFGCIPVCMRRVAGPSGEAILLE